MDEEIIISILGVFTEGQITELKRHLGFTSQHSPQIQHLATLVGYPDE